MHDHDDTVSPSAEPSIGTLIERRLSRRTALRGLAADDNPTNREVLGKILRDLSFPKQMNWDAQLEEGKLDFTFGRPIRWLLYLYGGRVVPFTIARHALASSPRVQDVPSGAVTPVPFTAQVDQQMGALAKFEYPVNDSTLVVTQVRGARPSPDGRRIAFTALDRLYVGEIDAPLAPTDTTRQLVRNPRRLTTATNVEHAPVWAPDGQYLAWVTWSDTVGGNIYRMRADGSAPAERLTRLAAYYDKIAYTKDGSRIMAVRGSRYSRMRQFEDFGNIANGELEYVWIPAAGGDAIPTK